MLEKQQKLFVQGYNLEVHDVIKYTLKHRATVTNYIKCGPGSSLCDAISRSRYRLSSPSVKFAPCSGIKKNKERNER